jgi:hypothetical protein
MNDAEGGLHGIMHAIAAGVHVGRVNPGRRQRLTAPWSDRD